MANYRYTYDYGGRRYEIDAPKGATAADLQAIIEGSARPAATPPRAAAPKPKPKKKEEESFLSGVIPTLKSATGKLRSDLGLALEKSAPYLGNAIPVPAPILEFLGARERRAGERLTAKAEAELPAASVAERQRQARSIQTAKPGTGSQILAGIGRATALSTDLLRPALSGVTREFLPQTPEEAARALAKVQAPFQTGRGAAEFIASQAPATLIPLGGGKAVQLARGLTLPAAGREAAKAALARDVGTGVVFSGGAINAASAGGEAYRDVLAKGGTQEEADRAFKIAALGAGAVSGVASRMPGLEQLAFASPPARGGIIRSAGRAAIGEAPQEFVEEAGAQLATNVAKLGTAAEAPVGEDVLSSGLLGAIGGATIAAPIGGLQGAFNRGEVEEGAPPPPPSAPRAPRTPPPPADMVALAQALGPVGGKVTLQEPTGPQEYVFQGFDEDGGVVLADADGVIFSEDPDQVQAAIKAGAVQPESGLGGMAFGMDITEGLPEVAAPPPPPPPPPPAAPRAPSYVADNAQSTVEMLRQKNPAVLKTVADLHAEDMTAAEIAAATGLGADTVRDVRLGLGLPDQGKGTAGIAGAGAPADPQERAAFETWRDNYKAENAPPPPATPPPAPPPPRKPAVSEQELDELGKKWEEAESFYNSTYRNDERWPDDMSDKEREMYFRGNDKAWDDSQRAGVNYFRATGNVKELKFFLSQIKNRTADEQMELNYLFDEALNDNYFDGPIEIDPNDPESVAQFEKALAPRSKPNQITPRSAADFNAFAKINEQPEPQYTPQQIVENLDAFAASEAQDRGLDVPMFREGARDIRRGQEPLSDQLVLDGSGPEALAAYKAGIQWAQERIAEAEPEPAPAAAPAAPPPPAAPRAVGKSDRATIPATREKVDVQYELQDLDNIRFAEGELQNRDRSRPQTQQFLRRFTSEFDPEGLGEDKSTDRGAPIINKDNTILSGNGRTLGLEEIYDKYPEQAEAYREFLREEGYDIEGVERPILVRRLMSDIDERKFVVGSNEADIAALSPPEQAAQDAKDILTPKVLSKFNGGDLKATKNDAFVSTFLAELSPQQRENAMDDKGKVSAQALKRIENALLYKAYGGTGRASDIFISKAMERTDDDTKTLTNSLVDVSKDWIKFQQAIEDGEVDKKYNITNKLMETVGTVSDIKASGNSVSFELRSPDMVEPMDPFVRDILLAFYDDKISRMLSRKAIAEKLRAYTEVASNQQPEPDMFGMAETPSARAIWKRVDGGEGVGQADMFGEVEKPSQAKSRKPRGRLLSGTAAVLRDPNRAIQYAIYRMQDAWSSLTGKAIQADAKLTDLLRDPDILRRMNPAQRELAAALAAVIDDDVNVKIGNKNFSLQRAFDLGVATFYAGKAPVVRLRGVSTPANIVTMLHEAVHIALIAKYGVEFIRLEDIGTNPAPEIVRLRNEAFELAAAYDALIEEAKPSALIRRPYGMTNLDEFIAEGLTQPKFQQFLDKGNLWTRFVELVRKLLGLEPRFQSQLNTVLQTGAKLIAGSKNISRMNYVADIEVFSREEDGDGSKSVTSLSEKRAEKKIKELETLIDNLEKAMKYEEFGIPQMQRKIVSALDNALNRLDDIADNAPTEFNDRIDDLEEKIASLRGIAAPSLKSSNENKLETAIQKAERELAAARQALDDVFWDDRRFKDRRTKERKAFEKEYDQLLKNYDEAYAKWDELYREEGDAIKMALTNGTPDQMRNAVAKAQKPTDKIIKEGADLQKKNRGCDNDRL